MSSAIAPGRNDHAALLARLRDLARQADTRRLASALATVAVHVLLFLLCIAWLAGPPPRPAQPSPALILIGISGTDAQGTAPSPDAAEAAEVAPAAAAEIIPPPTPSPVETIPASPVLSDADASDIGAVPTGAAAASTAGAGYDPYAGAAPLPVEPMDCHVRERIPPDAPCRNEPAGDARGEEARSK